MHNTCVTNKKQVPLNNLAVFRYSSRRKAAVPKHFNVPVSYMSSFNKQLAYEKACSSPDDAKLPQYTKLG